MALKPADAELVQPVGCISRGIAESRRRSILCEEVCLFSTKDLFARFRSILQEGEQAQLQSEGQLQRTELYNLAWLADNC